MASFAKAAGYPAGMATMNVSLSTELRAYVDGQVAVGRYSSTSEYVRDLIRQDQDRERVRAALLEGAASPVSGPADEAYVASLRTRAAG